MRTRLRTLLDKRAREAHKLSGEGPPPLLFCCDSSGLFACVNHAPHAPRAVVRDVKRTVMADGDAHGPAPHLAVRGDETGEEVFVGSGGLPIPHGDHDYFIATALRAIPRTVFSGKRVTIELCWKARCVHWIEHHLQ